VLERLPGLLLRLEGLAVLVGSLVVYFDTGFGWLLLLVLFLAPDLSFAGYAFGPRLGAAAYNLLHTEIFGLALATAGVVAGIDWAVQLALIWLAHIGIDRLLGYGLKYPARFGDTHLQRV
jgi:Domain of unknown function (DUF4260)